MDDNYDFEKYQPRETSSFQVSRRDLLHAMLSELRVRNDQADGKPAYKIGDLGQLPDEELAAVKPVKLAGCAIKLRDKMVWAQPGQATQPVALFPLESPALGVFNRFTGTNNLGEISLVLHEETGWPLKKAWTYARGLFLKLVDLQVCVPG